MIDNGQLDNWSSIVGFLNKELRNDETEYRDESAYRKKYQYAKMFYDEIFSKYDEDSYMEELNDRLRNIQKERVKLRDEKSEYNKNIRVEARVEDKLDYLEDVIRNQGKIDFDFNSNGCNINSDNDMIVVLSDLHVGQTFASAWGAYNLSIAKDRVNKYLNEILKIQKRHNSENCFVSLQGDMISNSIHKSIAITNRENVIEQIIEASEIVSSFIAELSKHFKKIFVMNVVGNHSRIDRKEDALKDERLDSLIEWYAKAKLSHLKNIEFESSIDNTMCLFTVRGKHYCSVHGDYDKFDMNGVSRLSMMLGYFPYCVIFGHKHFPATSEINGIKLVQSGSVAGAGDDHTVELRLSGKPSQTILICNDNGIECNYTIELDL